MGFRILKQFFVMVSYNAQLTVLHYTPGITVVCFTYNYLGFIRVSELPSTWIMSGKHFLFLQGEPAVEGLRRARDHQDQRGWVPVSDDLPGVLRPLPRRLPHQGDRPCRPEGHDREGR